MPYNILIFCNFVKVLKGEIKMEIIEQGFKIREWSTKECNIRNWIAKQFRGFGDNKHKLVHVVPYTNDDGEICLVHYFQKEKRQTVGVKGYSI